MKPFFAALAFLTRIPVSLQIGDREWAKSPAWYPAVGLLIGILLALTDWILSFFFPPLVRGMLVTAGWVGITGGLHLDGLMDTTDGLGSHRERERMLAIMKDSRTGAMGVLAALLLLGTKAAVIASPAPSAWIPLIAAPVAGRMALTAAIAFFPYLREGGIGTGLREGLTPPALALSLAAGGGIILAAAGGRGLLLLAGAALVFFALARRAVSRLGGLTGDVYGALAETTEAAVLLLWVAAAGWKG